MKRYEKYKDSDVDWIGKIPESWEVRRIKTLFKEINERSFNGSEDLLSVSQYTGVTRKSDKVEEGDLLTNASTLEGYKIVKKGDLVSNIMLAWNGSLGFSPFEGITSPAYSVYRLKDSGEKQFFHYLFRTEKYKAEFKRQSSGVIESRLRLYSDDFFGIFSILPPLSEQQSIATFLDDKTAKIDQTIAIKQKEIELLKERRQILIQKAVTKGLDDTVKLKGSGVDWIGEIPEHWEVRKLKYVANVVLGKMICNEDKGNYQLKPYLKSKNIQWLELNLDSVDEMWFSEKELSQYKLNKGDIVVSEGGEVGKATLWNDELPECYIQNSAHKVTLHSTNNNIYHLFCFFVLGKLGVFESVVNKVSIGHLTREKLTNINFPHPSSDEQTQIVSYLEKIEEKIAKAITLKEQEIEKLKEYKTVLIDNVVTGKVRVN